MRKNVKIRVIGLVVAAAVLCSAVTVAALTGSPYETLKNAMLDAATYRNATVESHMTMSINGFVENESRTYEINGDDGSLSYNFDEDGNRSGFNYYGKTLSINPTYKTFDGIQWYYCNVRSPRDYYSYRGSLYSMISPDERDSAEMRFMELLLDLMVGDLKNNITMTSVDDGVRVIRGSLTGSQIPELVKAGLDVAVEQSGRYISNRSEVSFDGAEYIYEDARINRDRKTVSTWKQAARAMTSEEEDAIANGNYYDYERGREHWGTINKNGREYILEAPVFIDEYEAPVTRDDFSGYDSLEIPMKSIVINYVNGEAEVDRDGNLLSVDVSAAVTVTSIFGDTDVIDFKASARFTDIGSSNPACPIPGAEQLLTADYVKTNFDSEYISVYFTLNDDGSIDEDSVTTTYPGEADFMKGGRPYPTSMVTEKQEIVQTYIIDGDEAGGVISVEIIGNPELTGGVAADGDEAGSTADGDMAGSIIDFDFAVDVDFADGEANAEDAQDGGGIE